jgi:HD-GYP domain-containing protein (c-di-GMP phosphodiesterase class II)
VPKIVAAGDGKAKGRHGEGRSDAASAGFIDRRQKTPGEPMETLLDNNVDNWLPVALDTLSWERAAPCNLYRRNRDGDFVLFAQRGLALGREGQNGLQASRNDVLYVHVEEGKYYRQYLKETLLGIIHDPAVHSQKKAETALSACRQAMTRVFDNPLGESLNYACEIIEPTVDLILHDDQATRHLVKLTCYDHTTAVHSTNVGIFSVALSRLFFGSDCRPDMHRLAIGFFFHDLGKCRVPIEILNKPGSLSADERQIVNQHVMEGYRMLEGNGLMTEEAQTIVLQHHERDDGHGYPFGKKGADIHPYARICRLADVYEALTSHRPYHQRRSTFEALKFMKESVVTDLDEKLFARFVGLFLD